MAAKLDENGFPVAVPDTRIDLTQAGTDPQTGLPLPRFETSAPTGDPSISPAAAAAIAAAPAQKPFDYKAQAGTDQIAHNTDFWEKNLDALQKRSSNPAASNPADALIHPDIPFTGVKAGAGRFPENVSHGDRADAIAHSAAQTVANLLGRPDWLPVQPLPSPAEAGGPLSASTMRAARPANAPLPYEELTSPSQRAQETDASGEYNAARARKQKQMSSFEQAYSAGPAIPNQFAR